MKFCHLAEKLVEVSAVLISKLHTYPTNKDLIDRCLAISRKILPYQDQTSEEDESISVWNRPRYVRLMRLTFHLSWIAFLSMSKKPWNPWNLDPLSPLTTMSPLTPYLPWSSCLPWPSCLDWTSCLPWNTCLPWLPFSPDLLSPLVSCLPRPPCLH